MKRLKASLKPSCVWSFQYVFRTQLILCIMFGGGCRPPHYRRGGRFAHPPLARGNYRAMPPKKGAKGKGKKVKLNP